MSKRTLAVLLVPGAQVASASAQILSGSVHDGVGGHIGELACGRVGAGAERV